MTLSSNVGLTKDSRETAWERVAFFAAAAPMAVADDALRLIVRNPAFDALVEPAVELVGLLDVVVPGDVEGVRKAVELLRTGLGDTWSSSVHLITGRGTSVSVRLSLKTASDQSGKQVFTVQAQPQLLPPSAGLSYAKRLITVAGQLGRFGIWRWHPQRDVLELSEHARLLLRSREGPVSPEQAFGIFSTEERARLLGALHAAAKHGTAFDLELDERTMAGISVRVTGEPVWAPDGSVIDVEGALQDITESRRLQRQVLESERELRDLIGNLNGMAYRCTNLPSWPLTFVSSGALELTGYTAMELLAQRPSFGDLMHPDDTDRVWKEVQTALDSKLRFQVTYRIRCAGGELKIVWEQGCGVFDADGSLRWLEGFITDISEKEAAKQEVRRLNEELEAKVKSRTAQLQAANADMEAFGYSLAHDMRAPVAAVIGFGQALQAHEPELSERSARYLQRIVHNGKRMVDMIDGLFALARLSSSDPQREHVNMSALGEEAVMLVRELEPDRRCEISIQPDMHAYGDPRLLRQVFANLVGNAWKFSRRRPVTVIRIRSAVQGAQTVFSVSDNGVGFETDAYADPFQPFKRLHDGEEFEGTGIGLSIVQKIVHRHGGVIWAESEPDVGSTFYFTLGQRGRQRPAASVPDRALL
jgi:PAS domain S-box-containing protein